MGLKVHLWAGADAYSTAVERADEGDEIREVNNSDELITAFEKLLRDHGGNVQEMHFYSHGGPGYMTLGNLSSTTLKSIAKRLTFDPSQVFAPAARVEFHGCALADRAEGELFLVHFAVVFLRKKKATLVASSSNIGFIPGTGTLISLPWSDVNANTDGGAIKLTGANHLIPGVIKVKIDALRQKVKAALDGDVGDRHGKKWLLSSHDRARLNLAMKYLNSAEKILPKDSASAHIATYFENCSKAVDDLQLAQAAYDTFMKPHRARQQPSQFYAGPSKV